MDRPNASHKGTDVIDRFTSDILRYPDQADALKKQLRASLGVAAANDGGEAHPLSHRVATSCFEDFWDNVPI